MHSDNYIWIGLIPWRICCIAGGRLVSNTEEEEREKEKQKWTSFSAKAFGKKGFVKKSIFKTPETVDGKVGVGTCGISGQKMTDFNTAAKYRKGQ